LTPPPTSKPGVVSQTVGVSAEVAYAFASRMENLPLWASGLAKGIEQRDGKWLADSPMGEVEVVMAPAIHSAFWTTMSCYRMASASTTHSGSRLVGSAAC
jgi:hypothetical protein